jgi:hypothetical protein
MNSNLVRNKEQSPRTMAQSSPVRNKQPWPVALPPSQTFDPTDQTPQSTARTSNDPRLNPERAARIVGEVHVPKALSSEI